MGTQQAHPGERGPDALLALMWFQPVADCGGSACAAVQSEAMGWPARRGPVDMSSSKVVLDTHQPRLGQLGGAVWLSPTSPRRPDGEEVTPLKGYLQSQPCIACSTGI